MKFFGASMACMAISMAFRMAFAITHQHWCVIAQIIFILGQLGFPVRANRRCSAIDARRGDVLKTLIFLLENFQMNGLELIAAERQRQILKKGFSAERDDTYVSEELVYAAMHYAEPSGALDQPLWPASWGSCAAKDDADRIAHLMKAGALIAAEIDRLQRVFPRVDRLLHDAGRAEGGNRDGPRDERRRGR
jgi:hypothetical protein